MALSVRTNVSALRAIGHLNYSQNSLSNSLQRISSGLRINHAADDSAGLAVASRMESDNTSLKQSIRNANDGISMVQTAEGGLNEIHSILVRMRELSVQGSSATYTSDDRALINTEFGQLASELNRIASVANFNRTSLLNSSTTNFSLQVGIQNNSDNTIVLNLAALAATGGALSLDTLFGSGITTVANAQAAISTLDAAIDEVSTRRSTLGATQNRLETAVNEASNYSENLAASASGILDVDYAQESSDMTRYQIMQQAGVAALGQAKAIPQSVISLLS
jgi:flagellin